MSHITIKNLPPTPFFSRFLEGQEPKAMTSTEMRGVQGGSLWMTPNYPFDNKSPDLPQGGLAEKIQNKVHEALGGYGVFPCPPAVDPYPDMVTQAYPSDSDIVGG